MAQENKNYYYDRNGYNTYGVRGQATGGGGTDITKLEMTATEGIEYSSETGATIAGSADINDTDSIDVEIIVPIKAGDGITIGADDDLENIEVMLDTEVTDKLDRALVKPASAPASNQLVGINTSNAQTNLNLGTGLAVSGNAVNVTGIAYSTTAPTANNTAGDLKFVVLSSEPATYYTGYYYIITGA